MGRPYVRLLPLRPGSVLRRPASGPALEAGTPTGGADMICADCDQGITGAYVVIAAGESMSAARQDSYAHPPRTPECRPRDRRRQRLRQLLDGTEQPSRAGTASPPVAPGPELVPFSEVSHLFRDFKHTAWRLETRRGYGSDRASRKWQHWLAGEDIAAEPLDAWQLNVRAATDEGRRFERVRLVDDPPTAGQRFLLSSAPGNVAAGEDIRNLWRRDAVRLGLPDWDFWLFDFRLLMRFVFDEHDTTVGVTLSEDPVEVLAACQARDTAWRYAIPSADFTASPHPLA
ncbi:DUF6879 family protein [Streptomyces sp. NPDC059783]|uniref:DUF6879 family protein n=1 Tax=Streptomyces sp. NPDC059783 TaxID=3346944 RepID=UPI0036645719